VGSVIPLGILFMRPIFPRRINSSIWEQVRLWAEAAGQQERTPANASARVKPTEWAANIRSLLGAAILRR
jgi:hypothetical protein